MIPCKSDEHVTLNPIRFFFLHPQTVNGSIADFALLQTNEVVRGQESLRLYLSTLTSGQRSPSLPVSPWTLTPRF